MKAAEQALTRMTDLLGNLAAAGAFPPNMADMLHQLFKEREELGHLMEAGVCFCSFVEVNLLKSNHAVM